MSLNERKGNTYAFHHYFRIMKYDRLLKTGHNKTRGVFIESNIYTTGLY